MTKIWRYEGPNEDKCYGGWFIAFIDSAGCLAVLSDYGDYSYRWHSPGASMRHFLLCCNTGYVADKFGYNVKAEIDGDATRKGIREYILETRRQGTLTKEEARLEWENSRNDFDSDVDFSDWMQGSNFDDSYEFYRSRKPQLEAFMRQVWPRLVECIREDLESEKQVEVTL